MVSLDSSIAFLTYLTLVSSAAAGVTNAVKTVVPFLGTDYVAEEDCPEDHNRAGRLSLYKKGGNLLVSVAAAGSIFGVLGLDPAKILAGLPQVESADPWHDGVWIWGIVAVFGAPLFHSLLRIVEGIKENVNTLPVTKPKQRVNGRK